MTILRLFAIALTAAISMQSGFVYAKPAPFPDMERAWYRYAQAVEGLRERDIINGYPDGTFRPDSPINRAELLKIIFKGKSVTTAERRCFSDINPDAWYAPYVCTAKRRGIIDGYPDGTYKPDRTVNFAEAMKIILGAYGREMEDAQGEQWYQPYTRYLDEKDILPAHSYIPWEELTRVRASDMLWRILRYDEEGIIPRFSEGCGRAVPQNPGTVEVNGRQRSFLLTVPDKYDLHNPVPLLIAFHGRTNSNEQVRSYYGFDKSFSDLIIAYPEAVKNDNGTYSWSDAGDRASQLRDIAFFDAQVEQISQRYCIDMDTILVAGHSLGAWFSNSLACVRGDVIRGSASVGGASVITDCTGPAAAMIIHNPNDQLSPFSGSVANREQRVKENGCNWDASSVPPEPLKCVAHAGCPENPVHFCPHTNDLSHNGSYYPHNWPRSASAGIAEFFQSLR